MPTTEVGREGGTAHPSLPGGGREVGARLPLESWASREGGGPCPVVPLLSEGRGRVGLEKVGRVGPIQLSPREKVDRWKQKASSALVAPRLRWGGQLCRKEAFYRIEHDLVPTFLTDVMDLISLPIAISCGQLGWEFPKSDPLTSNPPMSCVVCGGAPWGSVLQIGWP